MMKHTPNSIGKLIRDTRKELGITQKDLALTSGMGLRFLTDLKKANRPARLEKF
jgi:HTH-type transcriptional regulator / antitoxin HipB